MSNTTGTSGNLWARHCEQDSRAGVEGKVVGTLPTWLSGRLTRNGPGEKFIGKSHFNHLFDGMAILHMVNIDNGKVTYTSRFLESESYTLNHRANRIVISEFGTMGVPDPCVSLYDKFSTWFQPPIKKTLSDNCLVNILQVKDELLAMTETNTVRIVDPATLETKPEKLQYSEYVSVQRATAHPHVAQDGTVYNLGFMSSGGPLRYAIISLPGGKIQNAKVEASVPSRWKFNPAYMHSFGLTEHYYILTESPLAFDVMQMIIPSIFGSSTAKALKFHKNEQTKFRIISRKTGEELPTNFVAPGFFNFHFTNCFESDGNIIIDLCSTDGNVVECLYMNNIEKNENDSSRLVANLEPVRYVIPVENIENAAVGEELLKNVTEAKISREDFLATASAIKQPNGDVLVKGVAQSESFMELPRINYEYNTKPYTYAYGVTIENYKKSLVDFDGIMKLNVQTGEQQVWQDKDYYSSEPVFVATPAAVKEDDGVIITILLHRTKPKDLAFLVLDAETMKEMARVNFTASGTVTPTFHGQFVSTDKTDHSY